MSGFWAPDDSRPTDQATFTLTQLVTASEREEKPFLATLEKLTRLTESDERYSFAFQMSTTPNFRLE